MTHLLNRFQEIFNLPNDEIGIISPYHQQVNFLKQLCQKKNGLLIGSVEQFQGQERNVIFITTVRSHGKANNLKFLFDPKRLNTAVSRAR